MVRASSHSHIAQRPPSRGRRVWNALSVLLRGLYLWLVQAAVGIVWLLLIAYLTVNSPSAAGLLSQVLSDALPGTLQVQRLQWGPSPGFFRLGGVTVDAPDGTRVIKLGRGELRVQLLRLLTGLQAGRLDLRVDAALLDDVAVRMDEDAQGRLRLPQAFSDPDEPPSDEPGMPVRLSLGRIALRRARYDMDLPAIRIAASGIRADADVRVDVVGNDPPKVEWHLQDVFAADANAQVAAVASLPKLPGGTLRARAVDGNLDGLFVRDLQVLLEPGDGVDPRLPHSVLRHADLQVELGEQVRVRADGIELAASTRLPFLRDLLGPLFATDGWVSGSFAVDPHEGFRAEGDVLGSGLMAGFQGDRVQGRVVVQAGPPGAAGVRVTASDLQVDAFGGQLTSPSVQYFLAEADGAHHVRAQWRLQDVRGSLGLTSPAIAMTGEVPALLDGAISGELGTHVRTLLRPDGVDVNVGLDLDLQVRRKGFLTPATGLAPQLDLRGGVVVQMGPDRPLLVQLDRAVAEAGTPAAIASGRASVLRADGTVHLGGPGDAPFGPSRLQVSADVPRLQDVLQPLGVDGITGAMRFEQGEVKGSLLAPGALGRLRLSDVHAYGLHLRRMEARLGLKSGQLALDQVKVDSDLAQVQGDLWLQLFGRTVSQPARSRRLEVNNLRLDGLDLGKLLPRFGVHGISGQLALQDGKVSADLGRLLPSLVFGGQVLLRDVLAGGERFPQASAQVALDHRALQLSALDVALEAGPHVTGTVGFDLASQSVSAQLNLPLVPMTGFRNVAKLNLPLKGQLGGDLTVSGSLRQLGLQTALQLRGLQYGDIVLGDADLRFDKAPDGQATLASPRFFPRFRLLDGSGARFVGAAPQEAVLRIGTEGAIDPFAVLGMPRPQGMRVRLQSEVATFLRFDDSGEPWRVEATLPAQGFVAEVGGGLPPLKNTTATRAVVTPEGVSFDATLFDFYRERLEVCGKYLFGDPAKGTEPTLLAFLSGALDIPRLGPLAETLAFLDLRLDILPDPQVNMDERSRCLAKAVPGAGRMRIEGPLDDLRIQGLVQTRPSRMAVRRLGYDIQFAHGGRLQIGTDRSGALSLTIPREHRLAGTLDDGKFATWGNARAVGQLLESVDFYLQGTDIPFAIPKEYSVLMGPDLRFVGKQLRSPSQREMALTGTVYINEGSYVRSFDNVGNVVGNAGERRVDAYSKPITETMPWIADVGMDLRVRGNNFEVASRVPFGKTDLVTEFDMDVTGTLLDLHTNGRAKVMDGSGSQISTSFNNLQFEVDHGWLDFNGDPTRPFLDLGLKAEIPVRATQNAASRATNLGADLVTDSSGQDEIVIVYVKISGVYSQDSRNFDIELASNKGDKEADVQCLIVSRRRCTDAGSGSSPRLTTDFLFGEFASSLTKGLLSGFVDSVSIDFDPASLGVNAEVTKKLGKSISMGTRVQTGRENRYNATFSFRITDRLSLNGLWRRERLSDTTGTSETSVDVYESKLRYKVPLED